MFVQGSWTFHWGAAGRVMVSGGFLGGQGVFFWVGAGVGCGGGWVGGGGPGGLWCGRCFLLGWRLGATGRCLLGVAFRRIVRLSGVCPPTPSAFPTTPPLSSPPHTH